MEFFKSSKLIIRLDVFEQGLFPLPPKVQQQNILPLFKELTQFSMTNFIIKLEQFKIKIDQHHLNLSSEDAEMIFLFCKLFSETDWSFLSLFCLSSKHSERNTIGCDVRSLCLFLFLQMFGSSGTRHYLEKKPKEFSSSFSGFSGLTSLNIQFNEGILNKTQSGGNSPLINSSSFSPLNSPRAKTMRFFNYSNESQNVFNYMKFNIKNILKLLSYDAIPSENDSFLTITDLEPLSIFLSFDQKSKNEKNYLTLAFSPLFKNPSHKVTINAIAEYITNNMNVPETEDNNTIFIQTLTKSVTLRDAMTCDGKNLKISSCEDSYIYIDGCLNYVHINNCVNCTIFISCVRKIVTIDKCENISISLTANVLRIGNTIDSKVYFYGPLNPIFFGDNRSITLAPNNVNYLEFLENLKKGGIQLAQRHLNNFKTPIILNKDNNMNFHIMNTKDFFPFIFPNNYKTMPFNMIKELDFSNSMKNIDLDKKAGEDTSLMIPLLAPIEYKEEIIIRFKKIQEMQNIVRNSNLNDEQSKNLHSLLQGYFKEWLMNTNSLKPITELIKLIDQE